MRGRRVVTYIYGIAECPLFAAREPSTHETNGDFLVTEDTSRVIVGDGCPAPRIIHERYGKHKCFGG